MPYTEEQIKQYLDILYNYTKKPVEGEAEVNTKAKCCNCTNTNSFSIVSGYKVCDECATANGHVLGFFDIKDYNRLYYRKKSIYQRKYYYEQKVNQVSKRLNLTDEQKCELYDKLMSIDNHVTKILNNQYCRKRMINVFYLIKKLLEEMGCEKYKLVYLKISSQTLEEYEKWWVSYKGLRK